MTTNLLKQTLADLHLSAAGLARLCGVSRQRLHQLMQRPHISPAWEARLRHGLQLHVAAEQRRLERFRAGSAARPDENAEAAAPSLSADPRAGRSGRERPPRGA